MHLYLFIAVNNVMLLTFFSSNPKCKYAKNAKDEDEHNFRIDSSFAEIVKCRKKGHMKN